MMGSWDKTQSSQDWDDDAELDGTRGSQDAEYGVWAREESVSEGLWALETVFPVREVLRPPPRAQDLPVSFYVHLRRPRRRESGVGTRNFRR